MDNKFNNYNMVMFNSERVSLIIRLIYGALAFIQVGYATKIPFLEVIIMLDIAQYAYSAIYHYILLYKCEKGVDVGYKVVQLLPSITCLIAKAGLTMYVLLLFLTRY